MATKLLLLLAIYRLIVIVGLTLDHPTDLIQTEIQLSFSLEDIYEASHDFGNMITTEPSGVLHPSSTHDVAKLVKLAYESPQGFPVSARGHGHSINGQAQTGNGVVVQMSGPRGLTPRPVVNEELMYVDVWGGELWIDVLNSTLMYGLAPRSWTDYLYLSVGGTLSNAGISGQAFNHGPQISNVHEIDVVTGKGDVVTCSDNQSSVLFHAVMGGLGQFGIITRARIALEPSPQRVRWIRVLYSNFSTFTHDQEYLISLHDRLSSQKFDYVEGFVIVDEGLINNWRSSFFSPSNPIKISSIAAGGNVLYCLEITKNYYQHSDRESIDQEVEALLNKLNYIPSSVFTTDLPYVDFLNRVHKAELKLRSKGLWDVPHPWLNLFVPKSRIDDFDKGVFKGILGNKTSGPILIYPVNKNKWDEDTSVVTPNEDMFYLVALLRSALQNGDEALTLERLSNENRQVLDFCKEQNIGVKQYLPHYTTQQEWMDHYGEKWPQIYKSKMEFDPRHILATGQKIFQPSFTSMMRSW
ncbi:FAD-linked oxidase-like protein [Artemisia annua]|uniref:cytokinin dehydrogenase n=1 Tax=Artemisia annua TaxID=35608 RepID=A0A2U1QJK8_ARTAN|nr:FAD-linked oxidase-like protein [Artemisia annua]